MIVRVFQRPDGRVSVLWPNSRNRRQGETDIAQLDRITAANPDVAGLPYLDLDPAQLPARTAPCAGCGGQHPTRDQWTISAGRVVVDATRPNPHRDRAHAERDLDLEMSKPAPDPIAVARLQRDRNRTIIATRE